MVQVGPAPIIWHTVAWHAISEYSIELAVASTSVMSLKGCSYREGPEVLSFRLVIRLHEPYVYVVPCICLS